MGGLTTPLPEHLVGGSVVLRRWTTKDVPRLAEAVTANLEHLRPWMPWIAEEPLTTGARVELVESWEAGWRAGGDAVYGVLAPGGDEGGEGAGAVLGGCGLHRRGGPRRLEIGYWIDHRHTGRGLGTEVARVLTTAALSVAGIEAVEIHHDKANVASGAIPRRLGYEPTGETVRTPAAPGEVGIDCGWRMRAGRWRP
jgi:RimJ/RimL family protein N-acetyltransferase